MLEMKKKRLVPDQRAAAIYGGNRSSVLQDIKKPDFTKKYVQELGTFISSSKEVV